MLIKVILLLAILAIAWFTLRVGPGSRGRALRTLGVVAFVVVAGISVLFPELLTRVARAVGVGRGTDLLLYGLVIVVLAAIVATQRRHRVLEIQMTCLARRQALDDAAPQIEARLAAHESTRSAGVGRRTGATAIRAVPDIPPIDGAPEVPVIPDIPTLREIRDITEEPSPADMEAPRR